MVFALTLAASTFALADNWTGKLLDASCHDRQEQQKAAPDKNAQSCAATGQSTAFVVESGGKFYKLDSASNTKVMTALKNRADRTAPGAPGSPAPDVMVKVDGSESAGTISVTSIEVQ